ncbi:MAG: alpha/beta fold hydrolase [Devosia sp.]|uniref:alpha/beta hydrolase family protein n=1 Tax=Devosia sp. TaxID=1871048 RepID=UPI001A5FB86F|nr:alpha/beta fold hydrolase [Devosia sp.]MBL8600064.1 alpha/beta fold hydrolase [Devosia sp.]
MSSLTTAVRSASFALALAAGTALGGETVVDLPNGIKGTLALPDAGATGPAVVMLHGFGSSRDEVGGLFALQAAALAAEGIASLRIDFRGTGESAGDMADTTFEGLLADAATARAYLAEVEGVDAARIGVVGYSFGAAIAMLDPGPMPRWWCGGRWATCRRSSTSSWARSSTTGPGPRASRASTWAGAW